MNVNNITVGSTDSNAAGDNSLTNSNSTDDNSSTDSNAAGDNNSLTNSNAVDDNITVGIDLGTTNSCIAIWQNQRLEIITDEYGNKTIPSIVSLLKNNR